MPHSECQSDHQGLAFLSLKPVALGEFESMLSKSPQRRLTNVVAFFWIDQPQRLEDAFLTIRVRADNFLDPCLAQTSHRLNHVLLPWPENAGKVVFGVGM